MAKFLRKFVLNLLKSAAWVLYFYRSHKKLKQKSRFFRQNVCKNQNNVVVLQAKIENKTSWIRHTPIFTAITFTLQRSVKR